MIKRALITGATSGIGTALAELLGSKGIELILSGRNQQRLQAIANKVGAHAILVAHLEERRERQKVIEAIHKYIPDLLINNAGFGFYGEALSTSLDKQVAIVEVNSIAPLECTIEAARALIKAGEKGLILNVSSVASEHPTPGMSVYGASKAFITMVSQALDTELAPKGVRVCVSCPGMVATDFANRAAGKKLSFEGRKRPLMSAQFAAEQIWKQIERGKEKQIFNWYCRIVSWIGIHFAPVSQVKRIIWRSIKSRIDL